MIGRLEARLPETEDRLLSVIISAYFATHEESVRMKLNILSCSIGGKGSLMEPLFRVKLWCLAGRREDKSLCELLLFVWWFLCKKVYNSSLLRYLIPKCCFCSCFLYYHQSSTLPPTSWSRVWQMESEWRSADPVDLPTFPLLLHSFQPPSPRTSPPSSKAAPSPK